MRRSLSRRCFSSRSGTRPRQLRLHTLGEVFQAHLAYQRVSWRTPRSCRTSIAGGFVEDRVADLPIEGLDPGEVQMAIMDLRRPSDGWQVQEPLDHAPHCAACYAPRPARPQPGNGSRMTLCRRAPWTCPGVFARRRSSLPQWVSSCFVPGTSSRTIQRRNACWRCCRLVGPAPLGGRGPVVAGRRPVVL